MKIFLFLLFAVAIWTPGANAQHIDTIRVMAYNFLNFSATNHPERVTNFREVIHYAHPDLVVAGEMSSAAGMPILRDSVFNQYGETDWAMSTYVNGPDTQIGLFYRSSKITLISQQQLTTELRYIYVFKVRPVHSDTTAVLYLYGMHLKASNTSSDEAQRGREAAVARSHANSLPVGSKFLYMGDFNLYSNTESAYHVMIDSTTANTGRAYDPLPAIVWHQSSTNRAIHTQSTRLTDLGDGGATGGMNDRFDFILPSVTLNSSNRSHYIINSMRAMGNDGNHYNQAINTLPNTAVPTNIANALYYGSDHLPVYADFVIAESSASAPEPPRIPLPETILMSAYPNPFNSTTRIEYTITRTTSLVVSVADENGREVAHLWNGLVTAGNHTVEWNANGFASGNYFVRVRSSNNFEQTIPVRFVK